MKVLAVLGLLRLRLSLSIQCWQCAATEGHNCPQDAKPTFSASHDACITWRHGNRSVLLQNVVVAESECSQERVRFWSRFVDLYYKTSGGEVSCCYSDNCNDGHHPLHTPLPNQLPAPIFSAPAQTFPSRFTAQQSFQYPPYSFQPPQQSFPPAQQSFQSQNLNNLAGFPNYNYIERNGNCEHYFTKSNANEWIPDTLVPLAFDRASESRVGVFYAKFDDDQFGNNDYIIVRIVDKSKQNSSMYTIQLTRNGAVSIHLSKLEPTRNAQNGQTHTQAEMRKVSVNTELSFDKSQFQGFWVAVRNGIDISIGRIGDKIIESVTNYSDIIREGPDNPYYFGLTVSETTTADFGVNCDMPGLHFPDTCVTDDDCEEFPNTVCKAEPVNTGLDPGTRRLPFSSWRTEDTLLRSCWCKEGHVRIPQSAGCYDPVRKVVTLQDACFANYHCNDLPNTGCYDDLLVPQYNKSCQCLPGNKPFLPDPRTGLVEGCAPLTEQDKATVRGCSRKFNIRNRAEWVPETFFKINQETSSFFVKFAPEGDIDATEEDTAVIRLLDEARGRDKMYSIKIRRSTGKISLHDSRITRPFFFTSESEREVDSTTLDINTSRQLAVDYVGFWVMFRYEAGYGAQIRLGLTNSPPSPEYALLKHTDSSQDALKTVKYIGFTNGGNQQSIDYGARCIVLDFTHLRQPQVPHPLPYYQQYSASVFPAGRDDLPLPQPSTQATTQANVWDIFNLIPTPSATTSPAVFVPVEEQKVIQPILKNPYLTKLQRKLLPQPQVLKNELPPEYLENLV